MPGLWAFDVFLETTTHTQKKCILVSWNFYDVVLWDIFGVLLHRVQCNRKKNPPEIARSDSFNTTSITSTKNQKLNTSEKGSHAQMLACSSQQIYQPSVEVRSICPLHHESPFAAPLPPQRIPNHPPRWSWPNIATAAAKDKPWLLERGGPWRDNKKTQNYNQS